MRLSFVASQLFMMDVLVTGIIMMSSLLLLPLLVVASKDSKFGHVLPVDLPSMEDLRVKNLESIVPAFATFEGQMFAGSLPIDHTTANKGDKSSSSSSSNNNNKRTGNLQFWLFVPDHPTVPGTITSWFNGGPGCSSLATGIMFEHGPVTVPLHPAGWCCEDPNEPLTPNPYGWTNATIMMYVEQPIGVGFSEATNGTPPPASEDDVVADFEAFLQNFYKVFSSNNDVKSNLDLTGHKLYLVGESYAGVYIPAIARGIYIRNFEQENNDKDNTNDRLMINLAGVAIGNGKIDGITQGVVVVDYAYWHGLIDGTTRDFLHNTWEACMEGVRVADGNIGGALDGKSSSTNPTNDPALETTPFHPFNVRDECGILDAVLEAAGESTLDNLPGGPNIYEYSTWDPYAAGEISTGTVGAFYNNIEVQRALNVPKHIQGKGWEGCIPESDEMDVRRRLSKSASSRRKLKTNVTKVTQSHRKLFMDNDTPWSTIPYLAQLLDEAKIDVLMYSGDRDIICCTQGTEESLKNMEWSGTREAAPGVPVVDRDNNAWAQAPRSLWVHNGTYPAGYVKTYKNLQLLTIYNAGHMVPCKFEQCNARACSRLPLVTVLH